MITEKDLQEAIAEGQGQRNPNANTCIKLAAFLTIRKEMFGEVQDEHHRTLTDATWEERLSTATLILAVAAIGCFPNFFINIISSSFDPVVKALQAALPVV